MNRKAAAFVLGLALALIAGGALWWWMQGRGGRLRPRPGPAETGGPAEKVSVELYFPADEGLRTERRDLEVTASRKDRIRKIVAALLSGPVSGGAARPFPQGVMLGGVQLGDDGTAYLDLLWDGHPDPPAGGSTEEMQRIYSLVDSLTANIPEVKRVVLLWNGVQRETFSGHLDTSRPLLPNRTLLTP
jgi:Sporulation and spore germination